MTSNAYDVNQPIDQRLAHFSSAGFTYIHWAEHLRSDKFYTQAEADQVAQSAERFGFQINSIHGVWMLDGGRLLTEDLWYELNLNRIQFISWVGGDCIVVHVPLVDCIPDYKSELEASERMIGRIIPVARKNNVRLAIENLLTHPYQPLFDSLFETFPKEELGFCFDSGHANLTGELHILERYLDRLIVTHLHDNRGKEDEHLPPGQGTIDWKPIISSLKNKTDFSLANLEVFWPAKISKETWCRMVYRSIADLWES